MMYKKEYGSNTHGPAKVMISGQLEIDRNRGVIYFHTDDKGAMKEYGSQTILRLCRLPLPMPERAMDVTHMHGCDWSNINEVQSTEHALIRYAEYLRQCFNSKYPHDIMGFKEFTEFHNDEWLYASIKSDVLD